MRACFGSLVLYIISRWSNWFCLCLDLTSYIPEISSSFLITSLLILSTLVYPLTLLHICTWFVLKVSVLIFLFTNWQRSTSLMYIGTLVVNLAACPYLFQLDWLSQSCDTTVCVWSCFLTSLRLRCRKISNNCTLSNFV